MSFAPNILLKELGLNCSFLVSPSEVPSKFIQISLGQPGVFLEILLKQKKNETPVKGNCTLQRSLTLYPAPSWRAPQTHRPSQECSNTRLSARSGNYKLACARILLEQIKDFFTSVQERQELPSSGCCRITVQHSLFQITAMQIKRRGPGVCNSFCAQEDFPSQQK